jgi:hypothetical protein
VFLVCETDLSPNGGAFDEVLASIFEHRVVLDDDEVQIL